MLSTLNEVYSLQPKYYGGDYNRLLEILLECKSTGTTFLVGGRKIEGVFKVWIHLDIFFTHIWREKKGGHLILYIHATCLKVLEDLDIPKELRDMFISIPEEKFRMDISSTEIRKSQGLWFIKYGHTLLFYSRFEMILHNYRRYIWMFANNSCEF